MLTRIIAEIFNDLTRELTYESLGLLAAMLMIIMCCMGKCGVSRKNGKVNVQIGDMIDEQRRKSTMLEERRKSTMMEPKYLEPPK